MSNKVNGLWAVNSSSVFMFFDSVNSPSVWRLILSLCSSIPRRVSSVNCTNTWWIRFRTIR